MTWNKVRLILQREVRDQLRDRRTLFMVVVLPLLLYPGLGIGMMQMAMYFTEQTRQVVVLGADDLPEPPLFRNGQFDSRWFQRPENSEKLVVITDSEVDSGTVAAQSDQAGRQPHEPGSDAVDQDAVLVAAGRRIRTLVDERMTLVTRLAPWHSHLMDELPPMQAAELREQLAAGKRPEPPANQGHLEEQLQSLSIRIAEQFTAAKLQVLVIVPEGFKDSLAQVNSLLASRQFGSDQLRNVPLLRPVIVHNRADDKSEVAYRRVRDALDKWEKQLLKERLDQAGLPETVPDPVSLIAIDIASDGEIAASMWSKIFPALLVIMALTGAFYPAVDVAAGEKERGTMETLLICPASRSEIVIGKFLTVLLFSMTTTMLNLISMGFTGRYLVSAASGATAATMGQVPLPTPMALLWLLILLVPLAAFFSALCLALATFARSNKEGQYYLTPLFIVTMGLTMFSMSPSIELTSTAGTSLFYSAMPVVGPALLLKALLMNPGDTGVLVFGLPVMMSSVGYSLLALWWAVEQFKSEDVLFRENERFELKLWLRQLLRDKEPLPTFGQAAACFVLMILLQFISINIFGQAMTGVAPEDMAKRVLQLAVIQQMALIAAPALFMAILLTSSPRRSLLLKLPGWKLLGMALLLPFVLHPLASELLTSLRHFFPQLPASAQAAFATMSEDALPLALIIGTFALTPALCEELAFRGFILTGFSSSGRTGVAIVLSSVTFGIIHMIPQQVFNATLLGLVLGLLAMRSRSLLPGIVFHLCFNALAVFHVRVSKAFTDHRPEWLESTVTRWFLSLQEGALRYNFMTLLICAAVAFVLITHLIRHKPEAA